MPALANARYEAVLHQIARGISPTDAYVSQGYAKNSAPGSVGRLLKLTHIQHRLSEIRAELEQAVTARIVSGEVQTVTEVAIANKMQQVRGKGHRHAKLMQIVQERADWWTNGTDPHVVQLRQSNRIPPGVSTGFLVLTFKTVAGQAQPFVELDKALLRELSMLEEEVGTIMGFVDPIKAMQLGDVNNINVTIVHCDADKGGQD